MPRSSSVFSSSGVNDCSSISLRYCSRLRISRCVRFPVTATSPLICAESRNNCGISSRRSEEHTSELQSLRHLVCRLLLEKKKKNKKQKTILNKQYRSKEIVI